MVTGRVLMKDEVPSAVVIGTVESRDARMRFGRTAAIEELKTACGSTLRDDAE